MPIGNSEVYGCQTPILWYIIMSRELSMSTPNQPEKVATSKRELSWKVASNLFVSFKYAWAGLSYAFETQRNFRIHLIIGMVAIALAVCFHLQAIEIAICQSL